MHPCHGCDSGSNPDHGVSSSSRALACIPYSEAIDDMGGIKKSADFLFPDHGVVMPGRGVFRKLLLLEFERLVPSAIVPFIEQSLADDLQFLAVQFQSPA